MGNLKYTFTIANPTLDVDGGQDSGKNLKFCCCVGNESLDTTVGDDYEEKKFEAFFGAVFKGNPGEPGEVTRETIEKALGYLPVGKTTEDLVNYYLKTETYSKEEIQFLLKNLKSFEYIVADTLPEPSATTEFKLYLIPSASVKEDNVKDEYITVKNGGAYKWEQIGSTSIDLDEYAKISFVEEELDKKLDKDDAIIDVDGVEVPPVPEFPFLEYAEQSLTDSQKATARNNIDVYSRNEVSTEITNQVDATIGNINALLNSI